MQLSGWDFPHLGKDDDLQHGKDLVGLDTDWFYYRELFRFWQSAQFAYLIGLREDWYERGTPTMWRPPTLEPGALIGLGDVVTTYTEVFEFSSRLSSAQPSESDWIIGVTLNGLEGRQLYAENPRRMLGNHHISQIETFGWEATFTREQLLANAGDLATAKARDLLLRFRADLSLDVLRDIQRDARRVS